MSGLSSSKHGAFSERQAVVELLPATIIPQAFTAVSANVQLTASNKLGPYSKGQAVTMQADQNCFVLPVATAAGTVSATTGWYLAANTFYRFFINPGFEYLAVIRASADGTLKLGIGSP